MFFTYYSLFPPYAASFSEFMVQGHESPAPPDPPSADDLSTIMYTSGTTGNPKGVMLTHRSLVHVLFSLMHMTKQCADIEWAGDVMISYLPLAHIFERACEDMMTFCGCAIGYWRGHVRGLMDDLAKLQPTVLPGVPRIFDRIYQAVQSQLSKSVLRRTVYQWAFSRKRSFLMEGFPVDTASPLADWLAFSDIHARLGGRVRVVVSGAAAMPAHIEEFVRVALGAKFAQGYGLTGERW